MRDLTIICLIAICLVATLRKPIWGGFAWIFVSVSSFHQQGYATANFPIAMAVGGCLLISIAVHRKEFGITWTAPLIWFSAFTLWMNITYIASFALDENFSMWVRVMKINLFMFVVAGVILTRKDIAGVIWTIVLSIAITGVKGGLFTIMTGGTYRVWGPGGFVGGNNEFALVLIMAIPLMFYLRSTTENRWVKYGLLCAMLLCAIASLGSHSRGALLAMVAMGGMLIAKSKQRMGLIALALLLIALVPMLMPEEWFARMDSIKDYEADRSAMGRINAWTMAFNLAKDRLFGSSFENISTSYFALYGLDTEYIQGPHSIYFQVLGQHGFVGLFLFLAMGFSLWRRASRIVSNSDKTAKLGIDDAMLAQMIKVSILGFAVGGAFLALAYFDVPYYLMLVIAKLDQIVSNEKTRHATGKEVTL